VWPMGKNTPIVVDPEARFGAPSVASAAVTTGHCLHPSAPTERRKWWRTGSASRLTEVRAAVRFEQSHVRGAKAA